MANETETQNPTVEIPKGKFYQMIKDWKEDMPFEETFRLSVRYPKKYQMVKSLIGEPRYGNTKQLIRDFIPPSELQTRELSAMKADLKADYLKTFGADFEADSTEAKDFEEGVVSFVETDELLSTLAGELPIHVMGAITNVMLFSNITDEQKREELRLFFCR